MALLVTGSYDTPIGTTVPSVYWRWTGLGIDVSRQNANLTLYAYVDENAFNTGKQNIGQRNITLSGDDFITIATQLENPTDYPGLSNVIYNYIKENIEEFATATDA